MSTVPKELAEAWRARLSESGFDDIESPGGMARRGMERITSGKANDGLALLVHARAQQDAAVEALRLPAVWRGLPPAARRWWALVAICGWSDERAGRFVRVRHRRGIHAGCTRGVTHMVYDRWRAVILERICRRGGAR